MLFSGGAARSLPAPHVLLARRLQPHVHLLLLPHEDGLLEHRRDAQSVTFEFRAGFSNSKLHYDRTGS